MNNISNDEKSHQQIEEFLIKEYNLDKKNAKLIAASFFIAKISIIIIN